MTPLDLLLLALAFLAGALGLWLIACFVIAGVVLFKPRGKTPKPPTTTPVNQFFIDGNVEKDAASVSRQIAKAVRP